MANNNKSNPLYFDTPWSGLTGKFRVKKLIPIDATSGSSFELKEYNSTLTIPTVVTNSVSGGTNGVSTIQTSDLYDTATKKIGTASASFGGTNKINTNKIWPVSNTFAFESWIYISNTCYDCVLMAIGIKDNLKKSFDLYFNPGSNFISLFQNNEGVTQDQNNGSTADITVDTFFHCVVNYSPTSIEAFINGTKITDWGATAYTPGTFTPDAGATFYIGAPVAQGDLGYDTGQIGNQDNVRFYNRFLTQTEVTGLYNAGTGTVNLSGTGWDVTSACTEFFKMEDNVSYDGALINERTFTSYDSQKSIDYYHEYPEVNGLIFTDLTNCKMGVLVE